MYNNVVCTLVEVVRVFEFFEMFNMLYKIQMTEAAVWAVMIAVLWTVDKSFFVKFLALSIVVLRFGWFLFKQLQWISWEMNAQLTKLTHIERRLMGHRLRGHEFVRTLYQTLSDFDDTMDGMWLVRHFGDKISEFFEAKNEAMPGQITVPNAFVLVRFYMRIIFMRCKNTMLSAILIEAGNT